MANIHYSNEMTIAVLEKNWFGMICVEGLECEKVGHEDKLAVVKGSMNTILRDNVSDGSTREGEDSGISGEIESTTFSNDSWGHPQE